VSLDTSPVALRRTGPGLYTVTARLDCLTPAQRDHLGEAQLARRPLSPVLSAEKMTAVAQKMRQ
jgi:hypothetical protein